MHRICITLRAPSRRRVFQKLNEKLLTAETEAVSELVKETFAQNMFSSKSPRSMEETDVFIQSRVAEKARRMVGISRKSSVNVEKIRSKQMVGSDEPVDDIDSTESSSTFPSRTSGTTSPLDQYSSMKGTKYHMQDLTHAEVRRVQELREKRKMLDRKIAWLKSAAPLDPIKSLNKEFNRREKMEFRKQLDETHEESSKPPSAIPALDEADPTCDSRARKVLLKMERDTAISRLRSEIRQEKLARSAANNLTTPNIGDLITDPMKKHLKRRTVRVSLLLHQYLEELLTCNSSQILIDHLGGAALSIDRVVAPTTRGRHDVYVRVSTNHDKGWVEKQLNIVAPKIRSQIAVRLNYGYTPEFKFHVLCDLDKFNKKRLMTMADEVREKIDRDLNNHFIKEMNWK